MNSTEPATLDAHAYRTVAIQIYNIFERLLAFDAQGRVGPGLAESWDAPNPTTLVFKLRKGVTFHDGSPFNAQVVKWNVEHIMNPDTVAPTARPALSSVDTVEVVDDYTVRLNLKAPSSDILYNLATTPLSIMTPTAVAKWGKDVAAHPVGTGPFVFKDWLTAQRITITRNANYWDAPKPYVGEIEWIITTDPMVIWALFEGGSLDVANITQPQHLDLVEKKPGAKIYSVPGAMTWGVYFNHLKPPMDNLDFRKALNLSLDREAIIKALFSGRGTPANSLFAPVYAEHNSNLPPIKRDLAAAKEALAKSGYKGEVLTWGCWAGVEPAGRLCESMQAQWKEAGVNVQISMAPDPSTYSRVLGQLQYDIAIQLTVIQPLETRAQVFYHKTGRLNSGRFGDTPLARKLDGLVDEVRTVYDWNTRKRLFDELQQLVYDNLMDLYLLYASKNQVVRDKVQNFTLRPGEGDWYAEIWLKE